MTHQCKQMMSVILRTVGCLKRSKRDALCSSAATFVDTSTRKKNLTQARKTLEMEADAKHAGCRNIQWNVAICVQNLVTWTKCLFCNATFNATDHCDGAHVKFRRQLASVDCGNPVQRPRCVVVAFLRQQPPGRFRKQTAAKWEVRNTCERGARN